ncbi:hypothetical protein PIIN_11174 [Serendipita indica DSM 11827]|uniref:Uncharacterized protein n=1 Tax=Serendipita indica (strain DSM 11827) TaxID=1109443 RepID=G4U0U9_SERID|nr:hypothetical protein PIIN_11174 [Serendipita indica DSM 11827]
MVAEVPQQPHQSQYDRAEGGGYLDYGPPWDCAQQDGSAVHAERIRFDLEIIVGSKLKRAG